jgi:hypothetical protein
MAVFPPMAMRRFGYNIQNSLRFRAANSARLERTFGAGGNRKTWTLSLWVKRGLLGSTERVLFNTNSGNGQFEFSSGDALVLQSGGSTILATTALYRDPTAWYHLVLAVDTTQATSSDRVKLYVNGTQVTAFSTASYPSLNADLDFNAAAAHQIGWNTGSSYFDGLLAEYNFVNGQALAPSSFGETSTTTGAWVPKRYAGTYGTNGFFLDFSNAASTTTIGEDAAGSNDWTTSGISVTAGVTFDQFTDTPTNNYATWNGIENPNAVSLSWANTRATGSGAAARTVRGNASLGPAEKLYLEYTMTTYYNVNYPMLGLSALDAGMTTGTIATGSGGKFIAMYPGAGSGWVANDNGSGIASGATTAFTTSGQVIMLAWDPTTGKFWMGVNGTWYNSGDPAAGTNPTGTISSFIGLPMTPAVTTYDTSVVDLNCGQRPFAYTPPTGFKGLATGNITVPEIKKLSDGFVLATDTEANIETTLAAARSGWGGAAYVDILKNRAASETWAWRFSHDASNEHAVSTTDTYQARSSRTMSGSNAWIGHSIRIGSTYGTAAGSASHTNGAATTITHNLGRSRTSVFLFPRAGGNIYVYHPNATAGELLILNSTGAPAASTVITGVGSNSFQIGSGVATGTYDYLVVSEIEGFMGLGTYGGNSASDGTFALLGVRPSWFFTRALTSGVAWMVWNDLCDGYNVGNDEMNFDTSDAESVSADIDLISNGVKFRRSSTNFNNTGTNYATWAWGMSAKYSRAR